MNTPRCAATAQVVGGKLYVFGGQTAVNGAALNSVEVYNPATNSWTTLTPNPAATARFDAASAVIGGRIYVVGGSINKLSGLRTLEVLTP